MKDDLKYLDLRITSLMPHVRRIEKVVQENQDLFSARIGDVTLKTAADYLEKVAEQNEESATSGTTLQEYARSLGTMIEYSVDINDKTCASLRRVAVRKGPAGLLSLCGRGHSPEAARRNYIDQMEGKRCVINANSKKETREFTFPSGLSAEG